MHILLTSHRDTCDPGWMASIVDTQYVLQVGMMIHMHDTYVSSDYTILVLHTLMFLGAVTEVALCAAQGEHGLRHGLLLLPLVMVAGLSLADEHLWRPMLYVWDVMQT